MPFAVRSSLHYQVYEPSTFLLAFRCLESGRQRLLNELLTTSAPVERFDLSVGIDRSPMTRLHVPEAGPLTVCYSASVETGNALVDIEQVPDADIGSVGEREIPYLFPSRYAPSDAIRGAASDLFGSYGGAFATALAIEDWLFQHIAYEIGASTEQSGATDTFLSRTGVCRDFAHLGIAFCRALNLPARYVTIYSYQLQPQDFHAVFEVFIGGVWYVMDGTRKAPLNGMVRIASGRDASDVSVATIFGNVTGTGVEVQVDVEQGSDGGTFFPLTRQSLREQGKALIMI